MTLNLDQLVYERALDQPLLTRPPRGWLTSPTLLCNTNLEPDALWLVPVAVAVLGVPQACTRVLAICMWFGWCTHAVSLSERPGGAEPLDCTARGQA